MALKGLIRPLRALAFNRALNGLPKPFKDLPKDFSKSFKGLLKYLNVF